MESPTDLLDKDEEAGGVGLARHWMMVGLELPFFASCNCRAAVEVDRLGLLGAVK